ncbi:MAG TPA: GNAT family N-acetyltransferase [Candidatus Elarobacter sp.]|nr:GNAT family N-acetyltransferase [Candidatus Elarobacter sp.]
MERTTGAPDTARFFFVRPAGANDAAALARLRAASLAEQGYLMEADVAAFVERATADTARLFREERLVAWLACAGDVVVGSACAVYFDRLPYPDGTLHAELSGVYVEPAYRGVGHASRLVAAVVETVRTSGVRRTFLRPSPGARSLYTRLGFVDDATGVMSLSA